MSAGFVDLDVKFVDANSPVLGVAVDSVIGLVYNSHGAKVDEVIPDPVLDEGTLYYVKADYDVRDLVKFGGEPWIKVVWQAVKMGVALPDFEKRYWTVPAGREYVNKTYIRWEVPTGLTKPIIYYEVYRVREPYTDTLVGKTSSQFFIDDTEFDNEFEARSWRYYAKAVYSDNTIALQPDGSDYTVWGQNIPAAQQLRTSASFCSIEGRVIDVLGLPGRYMSGRGYDTYMTFRHLEKDRFQMDGNSFILPEMIYATLAFDGSFRVPLIRNQVVEIGIPACEFRARFVVPDQDEIGFGELDLTVIRD